MPRPAGDRHCAVLEPGRGRRHATQPDVTPWQTISNNYAASVRDPLDALMRRTDPPSGGRLVLWHGPPGAGKTHLIRALAHAWREWCITDYVIDCDALLHGASEYLTSLLLDAPLGEDRWRLIVLEDAGEYLMPDAAASKGQGFSRLLNTLDGMVGQVTKVMVLVTTNRDVGLLDPAISRPGRCALALEVPPLAPSEAATWLATRGRAVPVGAEATLAELYATLRGGDPPAPRRRLGFGG